MRPLSILFLAATAAIGVSASPYISTNRPDNPKIDAYFDKEIPVALEVLRNEIGGPSIGADPGVLITLIPEPDHPDYLIYWLRDACLGYLGWLGELELDNDPYTPLRALVDDAVHALIRTQQLVNPSGNIFTGGLEEALYSFHIDPITINSWRIGSPAADGPPLRAVVLLKYADWLLRPEQKNGTWVADVLWPAINLDLQWIAGNWNKSSWDLWWPPVWGGSYWTASVQYRALRAGARISRQIGRVVDTTGYDGIASAVLEYTKEKKGYMTETTITNVSEGRSGIGCAPLTVSVLNYDPTLGCDSATFQPCSDRALSSLKVVGDAFRELFPINKELRDQFSYFGFFLEDQLFGGQVQYFASFNVAEQIFDALETWDRLGGLEVTSVSLNFFRDFDKTIRIGTYKRGSATYERLTAVLNKYAENTILSLADRTPADFIIPLVMDKVTGKPIPPRGALRSQVAVLGAHNAYNHVIPPSWANGRAPKKWGKQGSCRYSDGEEQFPFEL